MNLKLRRAVGFVTSRLFPSYSTCYHCGRPWKIVEPHDTNFRAGHGCFPLCQECWGELSIEQRLPYYEALVNHWIAWDVLYCSGESAKDIENKRILIRDAVTRGL